MHGLIATIRFFNRRNADRGDVYDEAKRKPQLSRFAVDKMILHLLFPSVADVVEKGATSGPERFSYLRAQIGESLQKTCNVIISLWLPEIQLRQPVLPLASLWSLQPL